MMNGKASLPAPRFATYAAAVAITLQYHLTQPTELLLILPFERVAGCTPPACENLWIPAGAVHRALHRLLHSGPTANLESSHS